MYHIYDLFHNLRLTNYIDMHFEITNFIITAYICVNLYKVSVNLNRKPQQIQFFH